MTSKKTFLRDMTLMTKPSAKGQQNKKSISPVSTFIFQEPEKKQLFDPSYGLLDLLDPDAIAAYRSRLFNGFSIMFGETTATQTKIENYIDQHISKYYESRRMAKGIMLGASHPDSSFIQKSLVYRLLELSLNDLTLNPERNVFLGKNKKEVKEIGLQLNKLGGLDLMSYIGNNLVPSIDQSELSCCWDGIGGWRW